VAWTFGREVGKVAATASTTAQAITLSAGASVPAGNIVFVLGGNNGGTYDTAAVTDSKGHTWNVAVNIQQAFLQGVLLAWTIAQGTWTNTDTVTLHSATIGALVSRGYVMDLAPPGTPFADKVASAGGSGTAFSSGASAATAGTDDLWVGVIQYDTVGALTPSVLSPVWSSPTTASQASQSQTLAQRYRNPSGSVAAIFDGTIAATADYAAGVVAFQYIPPGVSGQSEDSGPGRLGMFTPQMRSDAWF
jgi:hypothetical protein